MEAFLFNNFFRVPFKMYGTSLGFSYKSDNMIASDAAFFIFGVRKGSIMRVWGYILTKGGGAVSESRRIQR